MTVNLPYPAILRVLLCVIPFGRIMKPAQKKRPKRRPVCKYKQRIDPVAFEIAMYRSHKLMYTHSNVKRTFSHRQTGIKLAEVITLATVLGIFDGKQTPPIFLRKRIKQAELLFRQCDILANVADAE